MDRQEKPQYYVVDASVLPDIMGKVLMVKRLLARGQGSSSEACKQVGISRSAYYKYKDAVFAYEEKITQHIVSFYFILQDEKGVLSHLLTQLYELGANVLTVNQNIPIDSVAAVTVSVKLEDADPGEMLTSLSKLPGVVSVKMISGE